MWHWALDNGAAVISAEWDRDRIEETLANRTKPKVKRKLVKIGYSSGHSTSFFGPFLTIRRKQT